MASCPSCGRPAGIARATCLYCGAPAPVGLDAEAAPPAVTAETPAGGDRWLLVLDLADASEDALGRALGRPSYEVRLLVRRGGFHLHRVLDADEAEAESRRLAACGLGTLLVPEVEARVRPVRT